MRSFREKDGPASLRVSGWAWNTRLLHQVAPNWVSEQLLPLFNWSGDDAAFLWSARAHDSHFVGPPPLFNALKRPFMEAFERPGVSDHILRGLVDQLLFVALWRRRPKDAAYDLTSAEIKRALSAAPAAIRHSAAWRFFDWIRNEDDETPSPAERWRTDVGPLFQEVWPRAAAARDAEITQRLAWMAIEANDAFPEVVDVILDYLVPTDIHFIRIELRQDDGDGEKLAARFPIAFLRLLDALVDPACSVVPRDLDETLRVCSVADPSVTTLPEYRRLNAAWRGQAS